VIDTQLILRATLNQKSLPARILFTLGDYYTLALSTGIRAEIANVLNRPKLRVKFPSLTKTAIAQTLAVLDTGQLINPIEIPAISRDSKDDIFLATAVANQAQYIVSEDKDLLVLSPYQQIQIIDALAFVKILEQLRDESLQ
jgi:putative PIN family toxin of toxin-antitoxin system